MTFFKRYPQEGINHLIVNTLELFDGIFMQQQGKDSKNQGSVSGTLDRLNPFRAFFIL
jgi:hypothetical protein